MIIFVVLSKLTFLFSLYFIITALFTFKKKPKFRDVDKFHKIAVLIPARNEEEVIGDLIKSLNNSNYPKEYFDIIVLPNNCTDNTELVARNLNVKILKVPYKTKTKGEVLDYIFKYYKDSSYDAYIIIDADNLVHQDFLLNMNKGLNDGYDVAQCFRDAKNPQDNWLTGSYTMLYYVQNLFFNEARMNMKGSATINGTGFMVTREIINKIGFDTKTLTEDTEFSGICALNNVRIGFIKEAIVYDEHPLEFKVSWRQRKRWSTGSISCFYLYAKRLLINFFKTGNISSLDMLLFYGAPHYQIITFTLALIPFLYNLTLGYFDIIWLGNMLMFYLLTIFLGIFVIKTYHKNIRDYYKGILFFPLFLTTWFFINLVCLIKPVKVWEPIKHNQNKQRRVIAN
ncbi:MAG: glycosyltransferase [Ruminococcus sp.]|nr:glycosyltransferase [Ruminococcus sp.]